MIIRWINHNQLSVQLLTITEQKLNLLKQCDKHIPEYNSYIITKPPGKLLYQLAKYGLPIRPHKKNNSLQNKISSLLHKYKCSCITALKNKYEVKLILLSDININTYESFIDHMHTAESVRLYNNYMFTSDCNEVLTLDKDTYVTEKNYYDVNQIVVYMLNSPICFIHCPR